MNKIATFLIAVFVFSFFLLSAPDTSNAQALCCQITPESCFDTEGPVPIKCPEEDIVIDALCNADAGQCVALPSNVPTLSEWGLVAMAGVLGIVGFMVVRRRKQVLS